MLIFYLAVLLIPMITIKKLKDLVKIQSQLREKEYEMEKTKEQQKKVLENNNAKVLKRGEYAA